MSKNFAALILAAGAGTRMKSDMPKVLHQVGGKALVEHIIDTVQSCGAKKTTVVVGHQSEKVKNALHSKGVDFALQEPQLGTAHAVQCAASSLKNFNGDILILAGDVPLIEKQTIRSFYQFHSKQKAALSVLSAFVEAPKGYGRIVRDQKGRFLKIVEELDASADEKKIHEINSGIYLVKAKTLFKKVNEIKLNKKKKEYYLTDIVETLISEKATVLAYPSKDPFCVLGVNSKKDLANLNQIHNCRLVGDLMDKGVTIVSPQNTFIESDVKIGRDTIIYPFSYIERGVRIADNCKIGPFCRLRKGTKLDENVEVGSFVEVNRSTFKKGSKSKHLAYIGDTTVGAGANLGAGTITANYDGKNKHATKIGESAFIGSNTTLIAPVVVGKNARTGAGAVLKAGTKVPASKTAVGIPARIL